MLGGSRSSSNSNPSTRESGNAAGQSVHQSQVNTAETENANSLPSQQVEEQIPDSVEAMVEENVEVLGDEGITVFSMDYIKDDPGLRIPLDRFSPNIRDDVRFAYIEMGPTQPMCPNFPPNKDERCFRAAWYKDFEWLEYSVSKKKAYCHYCFQEKSLQGRLQLDYELFCVYIGYVVVS